mgnify:CR=1 FL=1
MEKKLEFGLVWRDMYSNKTLQRSNAQQHSNAQQRSNAQQYDNTQLLS